MYFTVVFRNAFAEGWFGPTGSGSVKCCFHPYKSYWTNNEWQVGPEGKVPAKSCSVLPMDITASTPWHVFFYLVLYASPVNSF